jgi:DNA polymerase alpha subunit A
MNLQIISISNKINKGPGWLQIQNAKRRESEAGATGSMVSWCKVEYTIENYRHIAPYHDNVMLDNPKLTIPQSPPLTLLTLLMKTTLNAKTQENEIVCACGLVTQKFGLDKATTVSSGFKQQQQQQGQLYDSYFCGFTKPSHAVFPYDIHNLIKQVQSRFKIELCGSERALLAFLLCKVHALDVDVIVGHDLFGFNLDILLNRCLVNKVPHWSRLGRLKRATMPNMPSGHKKSAFAHSSSTMNLIIQQRIQTVCAGRLLCDVMISSKELLTKCKSFDLNELASHILFKKEKAPVPQRDLDAEKNVAAFYNNSASLFKLLQLVMIDATYILRICNDLQCLQLAYQITCIAGNVMSRTLTGGRSERNEYLLLHAFYDRDFILPEKQTYAAKNKQAAAKLAVTAGKPSKAAVVKKEPLTAQNDQDMEDEMLSSMIVSQDGEMTMSVTLKPVADADDDEGEVTAGKSTYSGSHTGYAGGLVLEPRVGFYDKFILLLDFNSLYPSIIQEYNICFTTISRPQNELLERDIGEVSFFFFRDFFMQDFFRNLI